MSSNYTPWERVQISRSAERPTSLDYISTIFERYMSLHGDRYFGDDKAIVGGLASIGGRPVTVIGQQKGRSTKENIKRNFGMPSPEGYRKSLRLMKQAEKFHRPIILFVDTPGAFCGLEAEEGGVGEAIARNLFEMSNIKVPILSIMIGEGGSGGALAMAVVVWCRFIDVCSRRLLEMKCGVWKILHILYCLQKDLQRFFGKMGTGLPKLLKL